MSNCYTAGSVSGHGNVGGLVGYASSDGSNNLITNSYSTASVSVITVSGSADFGGLVGMNDGYANNLGGSASITNSYSTGKVNAGSGSLYVGGLVGTNSSGTVTNCFWDSTTSGQSGSADGLGEPTDSMKTELTFTSRGWDFDSTWAINPSVNNGYPGLLWLAGYTAPPAPTLASPANNAANLPTTDTLRVISATGAEGYLWQISPSAAFSSFIYNDSTAGIGDTVHVVGLASGTRYYWRVFAYNSIGASPFAGPDLFTTIVAAPPAPVLASPANGALNVPISDTLKINSTAGATGYHWQISTSPGFSSFVYNDSTTGSGDTVHVVSLSYATKYYWKVLAYNSGGASPYAGPDSFTTKSSPGLLPPTPALCYPANNATGIQADTLVLKCYTTPPYTEYAFYLSTDPSFSTIIARQNQSADATFEVTSLAGLTKYYWRIMGTGSGYGSLSLADSFTTAVGIPAMESPANSAVAQPSTLTLDVNPVTGATGYHWQVSTSPTFSTMVVDDSTEGGSNTAEAVTLTNGVRYYWRVEALGATGPSGYTRAETFTTIELPVLAWPGSNALNLSANITLRINPVAGATGYQWEISTSPAFASMFIDDSTMGTGDTAVAVALTAGHEYYWRVQAFYVNVISPFTATDSFSVMTVPAVPLLVYPANNASYQRADTLALGWHSVAADTGYVCEISASSSFSSLVVRQDTTRDTTITVTSLDNLRKYYWRVCSYNGGGESQFSAEDSFTTIIAAPLAPEPKYPIGTTGEPRMAAFKWSPSENALRYRLQIAKSDSLDSQGDFLTVYVAFDTTLSDTTDTLSTPLQADVKYYWHISAIDTGGAGAYSLVESFTTGTGLTGINGLTEVSKEYKLYQNYPNPFNPSTTIAYQLKANTFVSLKVYDVLGREVATLVNDREQAGTHEVKFDASDLSSGVYFYRLQAESFTQTRKLMILK